jgi:hypothetical protein
VGLLRALDPQCVQRLLHSPRATEAIEALVLAECKTTLSDKLTVTIPIAAIMTISQSTHPMIVTFTTGVPI